MFDFDLLMTNENEFNIVIAILGVEFVMNLGGRSLDNYYKWLVENDYRSPLYSKPAANE